MWGKNEILFLRKNYSKFGADWCAKRLNKSKKTVAMKASRLSLKLNKDLRSHIAKNAYVFKNNFKSELIDEINSDFAYVLGILWADGFVNKNNNNIRISCVSEDIIEIEDIFHNTGNWLSYVNKQKNWREQKILAISDKNLHDFLVDNDYLIKSSVSPNKILNKIPIKFRNKFLLGLIDGDGCFYFNENLSMRQFSISGTFNQDWSAIEVLLNKIDIIKYKIQKRKTIKSSSSCIRITNKSDLRKLKLFIYDDQNYGLKRKKMLCEKMIK